MHTTQRQHDSITKAPRAFSLIELIIVVVIIGIIGAIAIPRMSSSAENAARAAVVADRSALQLAIDLYETEHGGVLPHVGTGTAADFYYRLLYKSHDDGTVDKDNGIFGPYINGIPANRYNGIATIRIGGLAAGANTHGWRYDTVSGLIEPDHTAGTITFKVDTGTVKENTVKLVNDLGG